MKVLDRVTSYVSKLLLPKADAEDFQDFFVEASYKAGLKEALDICGNVLDECDVMISLYEDAANEHPVSEAAQRIHTYTARKQGVLQIRDRLMSRLE